MELVSLINMVMLKPNGLDHAEELILSMKYLEERIHGYQ
jgi:hypothetical protein